MSVLKLLQKEKKTSIGVCVPEHQKKRVQQLAAEQQKKAIESTAAFESSQVFHLHGLTVIRGSVIKGMVTNRDKILIKGKKHRISELRKHDQKVKLLDEGDAGSIILDVKGIHLKPGEILQVK